MRTIFITFLLSIITSISVFARSQYKVIGNDVIVNLEDIGAKSKLLKVEIWSENMIRIVSTMNDEFIDYSGCIGNRNIEEIKFKVAYAQNNIEITTSKLLVNIEEDGLVRLLSRNGRKLLVESDRSFETSETNTEKFKITQSFYLNRKENIYGFGQNDEEDIYSLRNKTFDMIQTNSSIASPIFFSEKGYAFIWDNYSKTNINDKPSGLKLTSDIADEISFFFINGPEWESIIAAIRSNTGQPGLLPYWAYGFHLAPEAYGSESDLKKAIAKYKSLKIPIEENSVSNELYTKEMQLTADAPKNQYTNAWAYKSLKDKYIEENQNSENQRVIIPTHTNTVGIQQYNTFTKAGEITSSWKSLKSQVSAGINSTLTSQPYWSTPIGGIKSFNNDTELMVRWFQFAAFTPVFQGPSVSSQKWDIAQLDKNALNAVSSCIKLRYQLLPYIYSNAILNVTQNSSMMRSLLYDYPENDRIINVSQQYLFGKSIMVCPITTKGAETIKIVLPDNNNWFDFWSGKLYDGGKDINIKVSQTNIPLFVKQGSIIPIVQNTDSINAPIEIRIYGGDDAEFTLYEDEKDGFGYKSEKWSRITFEYSDKNNQLTIGSREGEYPNMPEEYNFKVVLVSETDGIGNNASENAQDASYKGKRIKIKFE